MIPLCSFIRETPVQLRVRGSLRRQCPMLQLFQHTLTSCARISCAFTLRLHPRRLPGCAARRGQSHHAVPQQRLRTPAVREPHRDCEEVPVPTLHFGPFSGRHPVPAPSAAHAELHLHLTHHHQGCCAGKGKETEGSPICICL